MCILFIIVNKFDGWLSWQLFEAMCKLFNGIDEADMRYLKLVSIVKCSCTSLVKVFGEKDAFLFCCCSLLDLTLYNRDLKVCRITNNSLV